VTILFSKTLNEPRLYGTQYEWTGGTSEARSVLNAYNLAIVNTIRSSGGNNAVRHIMIPTHAAAAIDSAQDALVIPNDDSRIIVSQHTYWPYNFTMNTGAGATSAWGSATDKSDCDKELDRIQNKFVKKGIPVVIGEWGSIDRSNTSSRAVHAEYYAKAVRLRGMCPVWWDNGYEKSGGFALLSRGSCSWIYSAIADGLIKGANDATPVIKEAVKNTASNNLYFSSGAICYSLTKSANVYLSVYNMQGKKVINIINDYKAAGDHEVKLFTNSITSGNYVLRMKTDNHLFTKNIYIAK
jgi:aryl-phospho-beta-D-glucosidase BglC (GH1 family)